MTDLKVSKHAEKRMKERVGLNKKTIDNVAKRALEKGLAHKDLKGSLLKYINSLYLSHKKANNIKVFNNKVYLFRDTLLITVIPLPFKYTKLYLRIRDAK